MNPSSNPLDGVGCRNGSARPRPRKKGGPRIRGGRGSTREARVSFVTPVCEPLRRFLLAATCHRQEVRAGAFAATLEVATPRELRGSTRLCLKELTALCTQGRPERWPRSLCRVLHQGRRLELDSAGATGPRVKVLGSKAKPPGKENELQVGSDWLHTRKDRGETRTQFLLSWSILLCLQ